MPARWNSMANVPVAPGNVTAHSEAIQISEWKYICKAKNGSSKPFAIKNRLATRGRPGPVNMGVAKLTRSSI